MYGFLIVEEDSGIRLKKGRKIISGGFTFLYHPLPKFENDKLFYEDDKKVVLLDGAIINNQELIQEYGCKTWRETFDMLVLKHPSSFMDHLRGPFCGLVLQKNTKKMIAFTNHLGEKTVYYTKVNGKILIASHCNYIHSYCKRIGVRLEPCIQSMYDLLGNGAILNAKTPFQGIYRVTGGKRLIYSDGETNTEWYHLFHNIPEHELTLDECIDRGDRLFRQAIDRIFSKNEEYGYKTECDLSGGLDTRMNAWVAHDLGFQNVLNVCYSRKGSLDWKASKKIAEELGNEYFFYPLDGKLVEDVDRKVDLFGGQVEYAISSGSVQALESVGYDDIGICCMGLMGELQNGYWVEGEEHTSAKFMTRWRKCHVHPICVPDHYAEDFDNFEQMNLYEYSAAAFQLSAVARQQMCETASPFADPDYLDFIYKVPLKWRRNYKYVMEWMKTKYPHSADFVWQHTGRPVNEEKGLKHYIFHKALSVANIVVYHFNKFTIHNGVHLSLIQKKDMTPLSAWYSRSKRMRDFLQSYYDKNINWVKDMKLKKDIKTEFEDGGIEGKIEAINILVLCKV